MDLKIADRVAVVDGDKVRKARVATLPGFGKVGVTMAKGEPVKLYQASDVLPLYRYEKVSGNTPFGFVETEMIVPLMAMK